MFSDTNALTFPSFNRIRQNYDSKITHLLNDVRTKFLDGKRANVASELSDNRIAEAVVIEIQDILNNLQQM